MARDAVRERQSRVSAQSIGNAAVAVAKDAGDCSSQSDLVDRMRLKRGDIEPVVLETQMP